MSKNFQYPQPEPSSSTQFVGYDEQGRRRIRLKVPKRAHKNFESTNLPSSESYPLRSAQVIVDSSNGDPMRVPQKSNNQKTDSVYSYSNTPIDYSYTNSQYSNEKSNDVPSTTGSYQTAASSVSGTVPSYSTFTYYSNTGSYSTYSSSTDNTQGNTQTTAVSGPNTYTRIRVKVKKNKDGTKTIIGPAKGGVAKPIYTREDPNYRAPELPPHTQNERYVRGLTSISSEDPAKNSAVLDLDLKINNAVPYQDEINRHFFNAVPKKSPQIGDGDEALPENFRVSIPYNSRFMDATDTTMLDSTTLDTMTTESSTLDSFRTVVSRDMPSYWDQNKDAAPARAKLFIQDTPDFIDDQEIENFMQEEQRKREEEEQKRLQDEADKIAYRELAEAAERRRLHDEEEEQATPWADLLKEKPWKFVPRTKRMHVAPFDSIDESDAAYKFNEMRTSVPGRVNEYGIYMPNSEVSYAVYYPQPNTQGGVAPPPPPPQYVPQDSQTNPHETTDTESMLNPPNQSFEIPPYNPYQYGKVNPVMPTVNIPLHYQRDNDSSQLYHVDNDEQRKSSANQPPQYAYNVNNKPQPIRPDNNQLVSASQYNRSQKVSGTTKNAPPPPPQAKPDTESGSYQPISYSYETATDAKSKQSKQKQAASTNSTSGQYSYTYNDEEEEEEEDDNEEEEVVDQHEIEYSDSSESKPQKKKVPKQIIEEYEEEEDEEEEEIHEIKEVIEK